MYARIQTQLLSSNVWSGALTALALLGFMASSSGMILIIQHIMAKEHFHYSMTITGLSQVVSAAAAYVCCKVFRVSNVKQPMTWKLFFNKMMLVGFCTAVSMWLGNTAYIYLSVSMIQMLKSLAPVSAMLGLCLSGLERPSRRVVTAVLFISCGTALASYGELHMSVVGLACMLLAEVSESARLTLTQVLLTGMEFSPMEGLMYVSAASSCWFALGIVVSEGPKMYYTKDYMKMVEKPLLFVCAATMGFMVCLLSFVVIQRSSSLTLKVISTARNACLILFCFAFLGEVVTQMQFIGYTASLVGVLWYNYLKVQEAPTQQLRAKRSSSVDAEMNVANDGASLRNSPPKQAGLLANPQLHKKDDDLQNVNMAIDLWFGSDGKAALLAGIAADAPRKSPEKDLPSPPDPLSNGGNNGSSVAGNRSLYSRTGGAVQHVPRTDSASSAQVRLLQDY